MNRPPLRPAFLALLVAAGPLLAEAPPPPVPGEGDEKSEVASAPAPDISATKYWQAIERFRANTPASAAEGRALLEEAASLEYTPAQVLLGDCLQSGSYGFPKNKKRAAAQYRLGAERGNAFAQVSYGWCLFAGAGVRKNEEQAVKWLEAALAPEAVFPRPEPTEAGAAAPAPADQEPAVAEAAGADPVGSAQARAHFFLGYLYSARKDAAKAQEHFVAAATAGPAGRSGIYAAALTAAVNFAFGQGVPRDLAKANAMLEQSTRLVRRMTIGTVHHYAQLKIVDDFAVADLEEQMAKESAEAQTEIQYQIAELMGDRKSKTYNARDAVKWYELAAEGGKPWAMLSLAFLYAGRDLGAPDLAQAFRWFEKAGDGEKPAHYLGAANLAICLQHGLGTKPDPERAAAIFRRHARHDFLCYLGSIGQAPARITSYEEAVTLNQEWAAKRKDAAAQYFLGLRHWNGSGVREDNERAFKWLKKAAEAGYGPAHNELGQMLRRYPELFGRYDRRKARLEAIGHFRAGLAAGDASSAANLGFMTESGEGIEADVAQAMELYRRALALDPANDMAHNNLAVILERRLRSAGGALGPDGEREREEMIAHYTAAERLGDSYAPYNLGDLYRHGRLVERDPLKAYGHFETAAERGHTAARFILGTMHDKGEGVPVNPAEAAYHYRLAALEGHREALARLVHLYLVGRGVSQDFDRAAFWLQRMGNWQAWIAMGDIALKRKSYDFAVRTFEDLAQHGAPAALGYASERLSRCYEYGWGVKKNPAKAKKHFDEAVRLENPDALFRLARRHLAESRTAEALPLLEKAAVLSPGARFVLGRFYLDGTGVAPDAAKGWALIRRAADGGDRDALCFLAESTAAGVPGAPTLEEAIGFAEQAERNGHAKATAVREQLEQRRREQESRPEESAAAKAM